MTTTPKRRWYQFSLRTLLVFGAPFCVVCSWLVPRIREAERQRKAVEAIEKLGGAFFYDWAFKEDGDVGAIEPHDVFYTVRGVVLVNLAGLEYLKELSQLQALSLVGTQITDADLWLVSDRNQLKWLNLNGTKVTDAGLEYLKGLSHLQQLRLKGTQVTDEGVTNLQQALPNCEITR